MQPLPGRNSIYTLVAAVFTSWKEIAAHLGKGVRTVQRYERQLGLPVRRPLQHKQIVLAYADELDSWLRQQTTAGRNLPAGASAATLRETRRRMHLLVADLQQQRGILRKCLKEVIETAATAANINFHLTRG